MARAAALAVCAVLAVVMIVAMAGAPGASAQEHLHCDLGDLLAVCFAPINNGSAPDARCCRELQDQLLCFCRNPAYVDYLRRPNIVKALGSCGISPPECEPIATSSVHH